MIYDPDLLDRLQSTESRPWEGLVYRYMFGGFEPSRPNTRGARWNPPGTAAIYTALDRDTLRAELEYRLSLDVVRPSIEAPTLFTIKLALHEVLDLSSWETLEEVGLSKETLRDVDYRACQRIGGAVAWLEHDGLLIPSARAEGINLVVFPASQAPEAGFEVIKEEEMPI